MTAGLVIDSAELGATRSTYGYAVFSSVTVLGAGMWKPPCCPVCGAGIVMHEAERETARERNRGERKERDRGSERGHQHSIVELVHAGAFHVAKAEVRHPRQALDLEASVGDRSSDQLHASLSTTQLQRKGGAIGGDGGSGEPARPRARRCSGADPPTAAAATKRRREHLLSAPPPPVLRPSAHIGLAARRRAGQTCSVGRPPSMPLSCGHHQRARLEL